MKEKGGIEMRWRNQEGEGVGSLRKEGKREKEKTDFKIKQRFLQAGHRCGSEVKGTARRMGRNVCC